MTSALSWTSRRGTRRPSARVATGEWAAAHWAHLVCVCSMLVRRVRITEELENRVDNTSNKMSNAIKKVNEVLKMSNGAFAVVLGCADGPDAREGCAGRMSGRDERAGGPETPEADCASLRCAKTRCAQTRCRQDLDLLHRRAHCDHCHPCRLCHPMKARCCFLWHDRFVQWKQERPMQNATGRTGRSVLASCCRARPARSAGSAGQTALVGRGPTRPPRRWRPGRQS